MKGISQLGKNVGPTTHFIKNQTKYVLMKNKSNIFNKDRLFGVFLSKNFNTWNGSVTKMFSPSLNGISDAQVSISVSFLFLSSKGGFQWLSLSIAIQVVYGFTGRLI